MIKSFRHRGLRQFFEDGSARRLPVQGQDARLRQILEALAGARRPGDMNLPGWRFHNLAPHQPSRYSVRVTANYRVTFAFEGQHAVDVDIEDYH